MKNHIPLYLLIFVSGILLSNIYFQCQSDFELSEPFHLNAQISNALPQGATRCDSMRPVTWGDTLSVVKGSIYHGLYKGKLYGFCKLYADGVIEPAKYKRNPLLERFVIADEDSISYTDKFYVFRLDK